ARSLRHADHAEEEGLEASALAREALEADLRARRQAASPRHRRDDGMARRLVRHQASLIGLAFIAIAACSTRDCACAAGYAPKAGIDDLDPLAFVIWLPSEGDP